MYRPKMKSRTSTKKEFDVLYYALRSWMTDICDRRAVFNIASYSSLFRYSKTPEYHSQHRPAVVKWKTHSFFSYTNRNYGESLLSGFKHNLYVCSCAVWDVCCQHRIVNARHVKLMLTICVSGLRSFSN